MTETGHKGTRAVIRVLDTLSAADGWLPTPSIVTRTGLHKELVPQVLDELAAHGWVERRDNPELGPLWLIGPELPRIGLAYQRRLEREARELRDRTLALLVERT